MKKISLYLSVILFVVSTSCSKKDGLDGDGTDAINVICLRPGTVPREVVTLKSGLVVEKEGTNYYLGGDILLSSTQLKALDENGTFLKDRPKYIGPDTTIHPVFNIPKQDIAGDKAAARAFSRYPTYYNMWAMVRFTYDSNLPTWLKSEIAGVLRQMQAESNVRFYNATGQPTTDPTYGFAYPYIKFCYVTGNVSNSSVGRIGGMQKINLAYFVQFSPEAIIHEICHALGMFHEAQRPDRDTYVNINSRNLTPNGASQFTKTTSNYYMMGAYDFNSVMTYSSFTSATEAVYNTNQPMYTKKDGSYIYQGYDLSASDKAWINTFYIPYIARSDVYAELDNTVYKPNGTVMSAQERLDFQSQLNNGNSTPSNCCRIANTFY